MDALSTRVESTIADLKELKETLTEQASKMQATMKVLKQELGPAGGKMNAKAEMKSSSASAASGERRRVGRHAHERAEPDQPPRAVLSKTRALPGEMCGQACRPALSYCWTELSRWPGTFVESEENPVVSKPGV